MKATPILRSVFLTLVGICAMLPLGAKNPVPVFSPGDFDSKFYRIPSLTIARNGDIVAVADKRIESNRDLPAKIDVVCRISSDAGKTWGPYITVAENNEVGGYGDPAIVTDRNTGDILVISSHGNGLWGKAPANIVISRSKDNGRTWLPPVDISEQIMNAEGAPLQNVEGAFASSGGALQTKDGRLMFVLVTRFKDVKPFSCYAIYSDDGGYTWKVSENPGSTDGDESKVVQLDDDTIMMSVRNRYKGKRLYSFSKDGGVTWTAQKGNEDINDPACNGDIIAVASPDGKGEILLQSLPGSPKERKDVSIYASLDGGKTWPHKLLVNPWPSAYSALTQLPDGRIGILTEVVERDGDIDYNVDGYTLSFTAVPLEKILNSKNPDAK